MKNQHSVLSGPPRLRQELKPMVRLAGPVALAELGWMMMGLVDTLMIGRVSAEALGAVGIGNNLFLMIAIFGFGLLFGLDYLIATAFGAGDLKKCYHVLVQGLYLSIINTIPFTVLSYIVISLLPKAGIQQAVLPDAVAYMKIATWALLPMFFGMALRRYLQSRNIVLPFTFALIIANIVNAIANYALIFGHFGFPKLGAVGAAWATFIGMSIICIILLISTLIIAKQEQEFIDIDLFKFDRQIMRQLLRLGFPASFHLLMDVGAFTFVTVLAGRLHPNALAAHHIVLKLATFTFMVPLGISTAGAVRVGQAIGRNNILGASHAGWTALGFGAGFMVFTGVTFVLFPEILMRGFTNDLEIVETGASILFIAAIFQLFDGIQVVSAGILRGTGDTKMAMICNFIGHWFLGLPTGYFLCFERNWGIAGLWVGLCIGLIFVSIGLFQFWVRRIGQMQASPIEQARAPV
ncbi:MAG: MATE family efflux transporter [Deferribacteres bacterium]|nr:MATE family efflux transporter [candidate division KSB1 bacterium]MCB9509345.1 MATE family efflux transporter [Deferribacteres bacterium]